MRQKIQKSNRLQNPEVVKTLDSAYAHDRSYKLSWRGTCKMIFSVAVLGACVITLFYSDQPIYKEFLKASSIFAMLCMIHDQTN